MCVKLFTCSWLFVGREEAEDARGNSSVPGVMGENKRIWSEKASKQASRKLEHAGTQRFEVLT